MSTIQPPRPDVSVPSDSLTPVNQGWNRSKAVGSKAADILKQQVQSVKDQAVARQLEKKNADAQIVCPQCQTKGSVSTTRVKLKKGISGGKATGAILTGGVSLVATGLSRKESGTRAQCSNCNSTWIF